MANYNQSELQLRSLLSPQVARRFYGSLQCDLQCGQLEDPDLLEECQTQFCQEDENSVYYDDDYYYDQ